MCIRDRYKSVRFGLFAEEEITAADGTEIPANGLISEISLDENMKAVFSVKLPFAKYYVREIFTDEHYILGDKKYSFDFKSVSYTHLLYKLFCGRQTQKGSK